MFSTIASLFVSNLLPVLAIVALGAIVHRLRPFDLNSLVTLNLYLFVPAYLFSRVSQSTMPWRDIGGIGMVTTGPIFVTAILIYFALRRMRASRATMAATLVGGLFFNAGNFGVPLAEQLFGDAGGQTQALIVMFMNFGIFCVGYTVLAVVQGHSAWDAIKMYLKLPLAYLIVAALIVREWSLSLPTWMDKPVEWVADGMIPVALVTLGAQLAEKAAWPDWRLIGPVLVIKLLVMPTVTAGFVLALGLWPWPGVLLILASAAPTAVNTLLLTLELDGDAKTAADIVFWTTLVSSVTVALTLTVLRSILGVHWGALPLK